MPIYMVKVEQFDPVVLSGLPEGRITGSVKLILPDVAINIARSSTFSDLLGRDMHATVQMSPCAIDIEGVDVPVEQFRETISSIGKEMRELSDRYKAIMEEELDKLPTRTQDALLMRAMLG